MTKDILPPVVQQFAEKYPKVWDAYNALGKAATDAGPLDKKLQRLVKLALAVGAGLQGAVHSHVRRGLAAGLTREEMEHVAVLAITTLGWPSALAAVSWIVEEIDKTK
jgi:alkylhydroperoxidase/carboxymuconolactone decarboxylase family protein YurZ